MVKTTVSTRLHPEVHKLLKEQAHAEWRTPSAVLQDIVHDYYALRLDDPSVLEGYRARLK